jgi:hypothetical protein
VPPRVPRTAQRLGQVRRCVRRAASLFFPFRRACLAVQEARWDSDRRARIAQALEQEHTAAMARTLDAIRRLPEMTDPPANI